MPRYYIDNKTATITILKMIIPENAIFPGTGCFEFQFESFQITDGHFSPIFGNI